MVMGGAGSPRQGALLLFHQRPLLRLRQGQRALWMAFDAYSQGLLFCDPSDNVNLPRNACSSRLGLTAVIVWRGGSVGVHVNESTTLVLAVRVTLCASSKLRSHHACDLNKIMSSLRIEQALRLLTYIHRYHRISYWYINIASLSYFIS